MHMDVKSERPVYELYTKRVGVYIWPINMVET